VTGDARGSVQVHDSESWVEAAGTAIEAALRDAVERAGAVSLALSGGATPVPVYRWLAARAVPAWRRVELFFGDERCVSPDDPDSNYRAAREALLDPLGVPPSRAHRMEGERPDRAAAAADYAALLPARLDILMLGVGREGHTASLFPGSWAMGERERRVVPVRVPATPPERLTITPPVLEAARRVIVLARGGPKADAVARSLEAPWDPARCPAQLARGGTWILDGAAASRLGGAGPGTVTP
jgi:6-phosphogluconolactonase